MMTEARRPWDEGGTPARRRRFLASTGACVATMFSLALVLVPHSAVASPVFTRTDSLFITAATGEPRFQAARDSAEARLRAEGAATLAWLVDTATARPAHPLTPRQSHYVERLFTLIADSGRDPTARRALERAVATARTDTARARWLYIGSRIGDTAFRAVARPWRTDGSEAVRRMAVRALGAYPHPDDLPFLWARLEGAPAAPGSPKPAGGGATRTALGGFERHMLLWALAEQPALRDTAAAPAARLALLKRLAPLLADTEAYNRRKVRDLMLGVADSSWSLLARARPERFERRAGSDVAARVRREWWLLAAEASDGAEAAHLADAAGDGARKARGGGAAFLKAEAKRMSAEERRFFGVAP